MRLLFAVCLLLALAAAATDGRATVWLENHTNKPWIFQVLHQYTDRDIQHSPWKFVKAGESTHMLDVNYRYGFLTTGVDNWKISGIASNGETWRAGHGYAADWKKHMLSSKDDGSTTTIKVFTNTVQFVSRSGNSETQWFADKGRGNFEPWSVAFDTSKMLTGLVVDIAQIAAAGGGQ